MLLSGGDGLLVGFVCQVATFATRSKTDSTALLGEGKASKHWRLGAHTHVQYSRGTKYATNTSVCASKSHISNRDGREHQEMDEGDIPAM